MAFENAKLMTGGGIASADGTHSFDVFVPEIWGPAVELAFKNKLVFANLCNDMSAFVADGGDKTNMVIVIDLIKYIKANGMGFLTFVPNHPNPIVPRMLVTPIIARDQPATSTEIPLEIKSAGRCNPIKVT